MAEDTRPVPEGGAAPTLSVVIPTHNVAPWIGETLRTVLGQGVADFEVIVVDDHSTDATRELVLTVAADHPHLRLIEAERRGGGSARNTGAAAATGTYLVFCDGDDIVPDGAYAALVASLESSGSDVAIGDYLKFRPTDTWRPTDAMPAFDEARTSIRASDHPSVLGARPCWNRMFRRVFWMKHGFAFPDVPRSNDIVPVTQALFAADRIDIVDDVVYLYRERPGGSSMTSAAASVASTLSYLNQELEVATLVSAHPAFRETYRDLVWLRDTYVAIAKMLGSRPIGDDATANDDLAISRALSALLEVTVTDRSALVEYADAPGSAGEPPRAHTAWVDAAEAALATADGVGHRVLVLSLVAAGLLDAARAFVVDEHAARLRGNEALIAWRAALDAVPQQTYERLGLGDTVRWRVFDALRDRGVESAGWIRLADRARSLAAPGQTQLPELAGDLATAWTVREADRTRLLEVQGGGRLELHGETQRLPNDVHVRLVDTDTGERIRPHTIRWREVDGGWRWAARFDKGGLPIGRPLVPALSHGDGSPPTQIGGEVSVPAETTSDAFSYEAHPDGVTVRRKRRLPLRAGAAAARAVKQRWLER